MTERQILFSDDNIMLVDDNFLDLHPSFISLYEFGEIVMEVKPKIVSTIDLMYEKMKKLHPDAKVSRGGVWLGRLAVEYKPLLSDSGYYEMYETQNNRGVLKSIENLRDSTARDYWAVVEEIGLYATARITSAPKKSPMGGLCLLASDEKSF